MEVIRVTNDVPIFYSVDVAVVGGGPAGVAAAVTAARMGVTVFLAEKEQCFGGMGTSGAVPAFMRFSDGEHFVSGGIGREIFDHMYKEDYTTIEYPIDVEKLKAVYDCMVVESGATFLLDTLFIQAMKDKDGIHTLIFAAKEKMFGVKAKIIIDTTGDGSVAVNAGAMFEKGDENGLMMPATLCSLWNNVNWDKAILELGKDPDNRYLKQAFSDGVFSVKDTSLPGMWHLPNDLGGGNIGHVFGIDGTDSASITTGIVEARKRLNEYQYYYNHYLEGYENAKIVSTGHVLGIRETRRIVGEKRITIKDYLEAKTFEDEIGRYCYPIDVHAVTPNEGKSEHEEKDYKNTGIYEKGYPKGKSYGIPYGCLLPKGLTNVLVAGRCISTDRQMNGSVRVMPCCYITGMAAGAAAAIAIQDMCKLKDIDIAKLRKTLREKGAYLP